MSYILVDAPAGEILKIGEQGPDFVLDANDGKKWRLSEQRGRVTALLFYPQNETLVCTRQMCSVRDYWLDYLETKASVVGISPGNVEENDGFSKYHRLPLPILADADRTITKIYGKHWLFPIQLTRAIVIVDARGFVRCRRIMLRAFRPTDRSVLASIYAARTDFLQEKTNHILDEARNKEPFTE